MGYSTYFSGEFTLDKPLTAEHKKILEDFAEADHRDEKGMPGIWCDWVPNNDGTAIEHNDGEKFYNYIEWIEYLIETYLKPWGYVIEDSEVTWNGEESDDLGTIYVKENKVTSVTLAEELLQKDQLIEGLDKLLSLVPDQLPLLMGINDAMDAKVEELLKGE